MVELKDCYYYNYTRLKLENAVCERALYALCICVYACVWVCCRCTICYYRWQRPICWMLVICVSDENIRLSRMVTLKWKTGPTVLRFVLRFYSVLAKKYTRVMRKDLLLAIDCFWVWHLIRWSSANNIFDVENTSYLRVDRSIIV